MSDSQDPSSRPSEATTPPAGAAPPVAAAPVASAAGAAAPPAGAPSAAGAGAGSSVGAGSPGWERGVIEKLAASALQEQRRARRWSIFFRLALLAYLTPVVLAFLGLWAPGGLKSSSLMRHTALVEVKGEIEAGGENSAEAIIAALRAAFEDPKTAGVVIRLNTPGGSPVQAGIVHDEIRRLRKLHPDTPVAAVVEEVCASGGYYIAAAADKIFVDKASLVGSIGVLMDGFGFTGVMDKVGVERRLFTAGRNKAFLDSFSPLTEEHRQIVNRMLAEIHQQFIDVVKAGRGDRLKDSPEIFSGMVWSGARSIELGLADALGTVDSVARDEFKAEEVVDFSTHENLAERLARRIGAAAGQAAVRAIGASSSLPQLR